ncbi:MAG: hypothetical protein HC836_29325 [Richelia sp. RM2_1_2]|nr:hypothetical protein [Richelia sp. RM1_1_1]NJO62185.1 hypothetical protein [Richelia sp. RM2_1_2]
MIATNPFIPKCDRTQSSTPESSLTHPDPNRDTPQKSLRDRNQPIILKCDRKQPILT